ncbi:hypothetical protein [Glaciimonas immobilis]|uniref:Uncharacterized protein n=1 Tax=Glaciimonas immobilis TaxID=728004 RepID=A0A840RPV0_9BURK|nr:hypothetical protein [Glaciimonas immobilis]KAF3996939.1 hypothetical protein HAV38_14725 [Glaciimonas immobilis]MBB5199765.1 hypothetical protein [Glaciimonas immobilis]
MSFDFFTLFANLFDASTLRHIAASARGVIWPSLAFCLAIVLGMYFKPLLRGIFRATLLIIKPRKSRERRLAENNAKGRKMARRMANDEVGSQPSLAAELRLLASSN